MATSGDAKARRTALRIVAFLGVLVALSCLGGVVFFQSTLGELQDSLEALDANVAERFPQGSVWELAELTAVTEQRLPEGEIHLVLVVGLPQDADAGDPAALRAGAWQAYCDACDGGGLRVGSVAIGEAAGRRPHPDLSVVGHVTGWEAQREDVPSVEERTRRAAPPDLAVVRWFGNAIRIDDGG